MINANQHQPNKRLSRLTSAISGVVDDFMMVSFVLLDQTDEESIEEVVSHCDRAVQYREDLEPMEPKDENEREIHA